MAAAGGWGGGGVLTLSSDVVTRPLVALKAQHGEEITEYAQRQPINTIVNIHKCFSLQYWCCHLSPVTFITKVHRTVTTCDVFIANDRIRSTIHSGRLKWRETEEVSNLSCSGCPGNGKDGLDACNMKVGGLKELTVILTSLYSQIYSPSHRQKERVEGRKKAQQRQRVSIKKRKVAFKYSEFEEDMQEKKEKRILD